MSVYYKQIVKGLKGDSRAVDSYPVYSNAYKYCCRKSGKRLTDDEQSRFMNMLADLGVAGTEEKVEAMVGKTKLFYEEHRVSKMNIAETFNWSFPNSQVHSFLCFTQHFIIMEAYSNDYVFIKDHYLYLKLYREDTKRGEDCSWRIHGKYVNALVAAIPSFDPSKTIKDHAFDAMAESWIQTADDYGVSDITR